MSKLDSSFPSPGKMKLDMDQVSFADKLIIIFVVDDDAVIVSRLS